MSASIDSTLDHLLVDCCFHFHWNRSVGATEAKVPAVPESYPLLGTGAAAATGERCRAGHLEPSDTDKDAWQNADEFDFDEQENIGMCHGQGEEEGASMRERKGHGR